jgi:uncharacterized protein
MARSATFSPAHKLPLRVRAMARLARGTPEPICAAAVESGLEVPAPGGISLLADHYLPLLSGPRPTLLVRTPYGRGFPWDQLFGAQFARQGFHVVIQSCRGTGGSGGEFEPMRNEAADGRAAVAWLREQEWFNGALGTIGPSYLGYVQWALAADPPPELRAMVAQNSMSDMYSFLYRDGALALEDALTGGAAMLSMEHGFGRLLLAMLRLLRHARQISRALPVIDAYPAAFGHRVGWFEQWLAHPDQADPYWDGLAAGLGDGTVPVSLVTGWDDVCLDQTLALYGRLREAGRQVRLLVGPWSHTSAFDKGWPVVFADALGWLRAHLSDEPARLPDHAVRVQIRGSAQWRDLPDWPPPAAGAQAWYTRADGTLSTTAPAGPSQSSFRYDPADPTPSVGGPVLNARNAGARSNKALEARADVLVFTSPPLAGDLEVIGPVSVTLDVRGSSPHFDIFARLCDVDPRGTSRNICDGLVRRGIGAGQDPAATAGAWSAVTVPMSATAYRFAAGHRVRLQLSGGAHPRFLRNTGTGEPAATATGLVPVEIAVRHGADQQCALLLPAAAAAEPAGRDQPAIAGT